MRDRFFHVCIAPCVDGLRSVARMLKVSSRDDYCIDIFSRIQLVVISHRSDRIAVQLLEVSRAFLAPPAPPVRPRPKLEVHLLGMRLKRRNVPTFHAVAETDYADLDSVVCTHNTGIAA